MALDFENKHLFDSVSLSIYACDVRVKESVIKFVQKFSPEVIINYAGISSIYAMDKIGNYLVTRPYHEEIVTNLIGSFHIAEFAHPDTVLIFIASVAGLYGKAEHAGYCASKAGVISLVQSLGMEKRKAYAISPGRVHTTMREKDYPGEDPRTRLERSQITEVIEDCVAGKYDPGDNIIIRKIGYETHLKVDKGEPWKEYLNVQPIGTPKTI